MSLQKTRCCPRWGRAAHRVGFWRDDQNLLVQAAVLLPPLPLDAVPCPLLDLLVVQSEGWFQGGLWDMYRRLDL